RAAQPGHGQGIPAYAGAPDSLPAPHRAGHGTVDERSLRQGLHREPPRSRGAASLSMGHQARKRFGQHFLADDSVIEQIVRAIRPAHDDLMVEIGPGLSALTAPLLESLARLTVVELDRDLARRLR